MFTTFGGSRLNSGGDRRARLYGGGWENLFMHRIATGKTAHAGDLQVGN